MIRRELFQQELELILSLHPAGGQQFLHQLEHRHDVALFNGIAVRVLGGQVLGHQQEHGSQKALGGIVEKAFCPYWALSPPLVLMRVLARILEYFSALAFAARFLGSAL